MAQNSPVESSPFHKVIRETAKVQTKGGLAALTLVLMFLCFFFTLLLKPDDRLLLIIIFAAFAMFGLFAVLIVRNEPRAGEAHDRDTENPSAEL